MRGSAHGAFVLRSAVCSEHVPLALRNMCVACPGLLQWPRMLKVKEQFGDHCPAQYRDDTWTPSGPVRRVDWCEMLWVGCLRLPAVWMHTGGLHCL